MTKYDEEKKSLLLELKRETLNQLSAVKAEDPERFLQSTDMCNKYIGSINALDIHSGQGPETLPVELRNILIEVSEIREEISSLIPPLFEKIKQKSAAEKKMNFARNRYRLEDMPLPSVFMDKKI